MVLEFFKLFELEKTARVFIRFFQLLNPVQDCNAIIAFSSIVKIDALLGNRSFVQLFFLQTSKTYVVPVLNPSAYIGTLIL